MSIENTLKERDMRYGSFSGHAEVTQRLKQVIKTELSKRDKSLNNSQTEALEMICHKIGRIINGDQNYSDSWHDIAGYATLVEHEILAGLLTDI